MKVSLFVGNIPYGALKEEIRDHFSTCGNVLDVRFIMDKQRSRFRGYGFVTMPEADARRAIRELHKVEFQGRSLIVNEAQQSEESKRRSA